MNYSKQNQNYEPEDTENCFYLRSSSQHSLAAIMIMAQEKWPDADLNNIVIESEYIHTRHINYDIFDSADWENFIIVLLCE